MSYSDIKEMLKDARNFASGANDFQTVEKLKDIQIEIYDLLEENRDLRDEIHELKNEKILESKLEYRNNAYFKIGDNIPYCSKCYDVDRKLVTMTSSAPIYSSCYTFNCPNCKNDYNSNITHGEDTSISF